MLLSLYTKENIDISNMIMNYLSVTAFPFVSDLLRVWVGFRLKCVESG